MQMQPQQGVTVTIPGPEFEAGLLPNICAVTGVPTLDRRKRRFSTVPPYALVGLLVGLVGFLIIGLVTQKSVSGWLPQAERGPSSRGRRPRGSVLLMLGGLAVAVVSILIAVIGNVPASSPLNGATALGFLAGALALLIGGVIWLAGRSSSGLRARVFDDAYGGRWLELKDVHPVFAQGLALVAQQRQMGLAPHPAAMPPGWPLTAPQAVAPPPPTPPYPG